MSDGFWVEILKAGNHRSNAGQPIRLTEDDLDMVKSAFDATKETHKIPLRWGDHKSNPFKMAGGWIGEVKREDDTLLGLFTDIIPPLQKAFDSKAFRRVSSGLRFGSEAGGKKWAKRLDHVAILGELHPAIKTLKDIQEHMSEQEAQVIELDEVPEDCQVLTMGDIPKKEDTMPEDNKALEALTKRLDTLDVNLAESKAEIVTLKADKAKAEKERDEAVEAVEAKAAEFTEKAKATSTQEFVDFCEQSVKDGKLTPAARDALTKDLKESANFSDESELLLPAAVVVDFVEKVGEYLPQGENGGKGKEKSDKPASEQLVEAANKYAAEHKVSFSEATTAVLTADAELRGAYDAELQEVK